MSDAPSGRSLVGIVYGLIAAATFGVSAPLAKYLLASAQPLALAGLLYAGGGLGLVAASRLRRSESEAPLHGADVPWLLGAISLGGVAGPALMLVGFARVSGVAGALLLNLEAPLTVGVATLAFHEHLGRLGALAVTVIVGGAMALGGFSEGRTDLWGAVAVFGACLCWALENNLMQRLSARDPWTVARTKMLAAGVTSLFLARVTGGEIPGPETVVLALAVGAVGYGMSNVFTLRAMREMGAARQAALFATAPFVGAVAAIPILGDRPSALTFAAAALMAVGVVLLIVERHSHRHSHSALSHDHSHTHDDPHHLHVHDPPVAGPHAHPHGHEALTHEHSHLPDAHHRHQHSHEK